MLQAHCEDFGTCASAAIPADTHTHTHIQYTHSTISELCVNSEIWQLLVLILNQHSLELYITHNKSKNYLLLLITIVHLLLVHE